MRKLAAAALAIPVLATLYVPILLRRSIALRLVLGLGIVALLGLGALAVLSPRATAAKAPTVSAPLDVGLVLPVRRRRPSPPRPGPAGILEPDEHRLGRGRPDGRSGDARRDELGRGRQDADDQPARDVAGRARSTRSRSLPPPSTRAARPWAMQREPCSAPGRPQPPAWPSAILLPEERRPPPASRSPSIRPCPRRRRIRSWRSTRP